FPRTRSWNLFDLKTDPSEMNSVHEDPKYARILAGLRARYMSLRDLYDVNSAVIPATRGDEPRWRERFASQIKEARKGEAELVFVGDSITQGWEVAGKPVWNEFYANRKAINLGIGGDRTENVIWRLQHGKTEYLNQKVAVLLIGTNNTGHFLQDPSEVAEGVQDILLRMKTQWPDATIVVQGIFPRGEDRFDSQRLNNIAINERVRRFADGDRVRFLEIGDVFLQDDGTISQDIMPDRLHLSEEGYRRWANAIEPTLVELGL
ncbi:MAG: GDSL-type esterase/lipase family protein, partial [Planctomycetota bacterium]